MLDGSAVHDNFGAFLVCVTSSPRRVIFTFSPATFLPVSLQLIPIPTMATDSKAVNGSYGAQYPYGQAESFVPPQGLNASNGNTPAGITGEDVAVTSAAISSESTGAGDANKAPSKDEVGWYFVESYYTTLSKNPETLYVSHRTIQENVICRS